MGVRHEEPVEFSFVSAEVVCLVEHTQKAFNMKNLGRILCMFLLFPVMFRTVLLVSIETYLNEKLWLRE